MILELIGVGCTCLCSRVKVSGTIRRTWTAINQIIGVYICQIRYRTASGPGSIYNTNTGLRTAQPRMQCFVGTQSMVPLGLGSTVASYYDYTQHLRKCLSSIGHYLIYRVVRTAGTIDSGGHIRARV